MDEVTTQRIIRAELKAVALQAGMIDLDGVALADLTKVSLNDKGELVGGAELLEEMRKNKPYLFAPKGASTERGGSPPRSNNGGPRKVSEMTPAEIKAEAKRRGFDHF